MRTLQMKNKYSSSQIRSVEKRLDKGATVDLEQFLIKAYNGLVYVMIKETTTKNKPNDEYTMTWDSFLYLFMQGEPVVCIENKIVNEKE